MPWTWTIISIIDIMERKDIKEGLSDGVCYVIHSNEAYCSGGQPSVSKEMLYPALRSCIRPLLQHQCRSSSVERIFVVHMRRHLVFSCTSHSYYFSFTVASRTHVIKTVRIIFIFHYYFSECWKTSKISFFLTYLLC